MWVKMTLHDVVVRVRKGTHLPTPGMHQTVLLRAEAQPRYLPIQFGPGVSAADLLALQLIEHSPTSAMMYDLTARALDFGDLALERVSLSRDAQGVFTATITLRRGEARAELEAGPGDALNLAIRCHAPIYVDETVLNREGLTAEVFSTQLEELYQRGLGLNSETTYAEWRSIVSPDWLGK